MTGEDRPGVRPPAAVIEAAGAFRLDPVSLRPLGGTTGSSWGSGGRILRVGGRAVIDAELAACAAAAAAVPVPRLIDRADSGQESAVLLERLPGLPAAELAAGGPALAAAAGRAGGAVHALLAGVAAPAGLRGLPGTCPPWPAAPPVRRVLHLDLHPYNVLVGADGELTGVIDWANAGGGDPVLDRARTWSILTLDPAAAARRADPGWAALAAAWSEAGGLAEVPAAARAWACRYLLSDLARRYRPADLSHVAAALAQAEAGG